MSKIRQELADLSAECEALCKIEGWVGLNTGKPNFHLLYSSVESYESGNRVAIFGLHPGGGLEYADSDDHDHPFQRPGYSAYLDDERPSPGESPLQRVVQALAMVLTGSIPSDAMEAMNNVHLPPEERIGADATTMLRNSPSGNMIPFRGTSLNKIPPQLREPGQCIGWRLLCLAQPKPHLVVTLATQTWDMVLKSSGQARKADCDEWVHEGLKRKYKEVRLTQGPLSGALLIALPGVVRDRGRVDVAKPMFDVLAQRLRRHGLLHTSH